MQYLPWKADSGCASANVEINRLGLVEQAGGFRLIENTSLQSLLGEYKPEGKLNSTLLSTTDNMNF